MSAEVIACMHAITTRQNKCPDGLTFLHRNDIPFDDEDLPLVDPNGTTTNVHADSPGVTEINNNDNPNNSHDGNDDATNDDPYFTDDI